jgi:membrane-anchored protein YejM (alkaline phosphatase superfamily)
MKWLNILHSNNPWPYISRLHSSVIETSQWLRRAIALNLLAALIIGLRYLFTPTSLPTGLVSWSFALMNWIGQFLLIGLTIYIVILPVFVMVGRNRTVTKGAFIALATILQLALILDTFVYNQFRFHINFLVLEMFFKGKGQVIALDDGVILILALSTVVIACIETYIVRKTWSYSAYPSRALHLSVLKRMIIILGIYSPSQILYAFADFYQYRPILRLGQVFPLSEPLRMKTFLGLLGFKANGSLPDVRDASEEESWLAYPLVHPACTQPTRMNVLMIVVDTLRADMLDPRIMPNSFALSLQSQRFYNHMSGSNSTRHGIASLLYGVPGTYFESLRQNRKAPVLLDEMRRQNYEMAIYASAPLTMPEFNETVFAHVPNLKTVSRAATDYDRDQEVVDEFHDFLSRRDKSKPFFSFLFFDSVHQSSSPPDYPKIFQPALETVNHLATGSGDPLPYFNRYKNSTHYVDSLIGKVLADLDNRKLTQSTLIILTADHGEEFNDNGLQYWGHNSNFSEAQIHVPLVMKWPGRSHEVIQQLTSHYDITPTLMKHVMGCESDSQLYSSGYDLFTRKDFKWMIAGTTDNYAIVRKADLTTVKLGMLPEVTDHQLRPINQELDPETLQDIFHEMKRFYRRGQTSQTHDAMSTSSY